MSKTLFERLLALDGALRRTQEERQREMEYGTGGGGALVETRSPRRHTSRVETAGIKLAELERQRQRYERKYVKLTREAEAVIAQLEKPKHRQVLELRYLCGMPWAKVSEVMGYTDAKTALRVHVLALQEVEAYMSGVDPGTKPGSDGVYRPR